MIRAIVCDDEIAAAEIIEQAITTYNLPMQIVGTANNGQEACQMINQLSPDLVFMDIHMPIMNGFEVMRETNLPRTIIITAYDFFEYAQEALRLGAKDIIRKPIDIAELKRAIERTIGWSFTGNQTINQVLNYIHDNYHRSIGLEELSQIAICTKSHLSRLFKRHTNQTIMSYIHQVRIEHAIQLMVNEHKSVKDAAFAVGYSSLNNFYHHFKDRTNQTPAAYLLESQAASLK